jgi:hypothetical protein
MPHTNWLSLPASQAAAPPLAKRDPALLRELPCLLNMPLCFSSI